MNSCMPNSQAPEIKAPKVSVIVPVYNTELYVERAITSLMEQTLADVQFIIIDDGSKDNSLNIIKQAIARYPTREGLVTLISRENRGVAATRAQGMQLATGDYVIHLDSDDWAELTWLEAMYTKAIEENADVVVCDYQEVYKNGVNNVAQHVSASGITCAENLLCGKISNMNWDKLIRLAMIRDNNITYINGVDMGEDLFVSFKSLFYSHCVAHVDKNLYFYNKINANSLTSQYSVNSIHSLVNVVSELERFLLSESSLEKIKCSFDFFKINVRYLILVKSVGNKEVRELAFSLYQETNYLITTGVAPKLLRLAFFFHKSKLASDLYLIDAICKLREFYFYFKFKFSRFL